MTIDLLTANSAAGKELPPSAYQYTERDAILYALGVGATAAELRFVYEKDLQVLPTFGVVPAFPALLGLVDLLQFNPMMLLHGEQRIELLRSIPIRGVLTTHPKIRAVYDKKRFAQIVVDAQTRTENGDLLFTNTFVALIQGEGSFGGDPGPSSNKVRLPDREPDHRIEYKTSTDQAVLYRLSGDRNPLHIDPDFAKGAGFDRPILHGLCTFGFVGRALLNTVCDGNPDCLKSFEARFSKPVYPGETIVTEIWQDEADSVLVQAKVAERDEVVLSNAAATIA